MKAYQYAFFTSIFLITGAAIFPNSAFAEGHSFPFPHGKVYITNGYGGSNTHQKASLYAVDFRSYQGSDPCDSYGAPILATEPGEVFFTHNAGEDDKYGTYVKLKNEHGKVTWYAHMKKDSITVKGPTDNDINITGDFVKQGQILGLMGDTGNTQGMSCNAFDGINTGAHLHFEMRDSNGKAFKPEPMQGEKSYTNLSKFGNPYISTTVMIDPGKFWDQWKNKVPYKLSYHAPEISEKEAVTRTDQRWYRKLQRSFNRLKKFILKNISWEEGWTNEKAVEYVKKANGDYSDSFLSWVGWKKEKVPFIDENNLYAEFLDHRDFQYFIPRSDVDMVKLQKSIKDNDLISRFYKPAEGGVDMTHLDSLYLSETITPDWLFFLVFAAPPHFTDIALEDFNKRVHELNNLLFQMVREENEKKGDDIENLPAFYGNPLYQKSQPDTVLTSLVNQVGLKYIDIDYDFGEKIAVSKMPKEYQYRYTLDLKTCPISQEIKDKLHMLSHWAYYDDKIDKLWEGTLPSVMKFFVQEEFYEQWALAKAYLRILENNRFMCISFASIVNSFTSGLDKELPYGNLQSIYDDFFIKEAR